MLLQLGRLLTIYKRIIYKKNISKTLNIAVQRSQVEK